MSNYNVGSDHSGNGDMDCINAVCKVLEDAGHTTNNLGVTPDLEGRLNTGNSDDIGVFIINGVCLGTIASVDKMVQAGGCSHVYFGIPKPIMSEPFNKEENLTNPNKKLKLAHDDNFTTDPEVLAMSGKYTVAEVFDQFEGVSYCYGETCEEVGQAILKGDTGGGTKSTEEGSIMSGWESITDLLKPLDGEAMVVVRGDTVIIKRIYPPEATKLWVFEGVNIVNESVTVSDYTPEIYNTFDVHWGASFENTMQLCFEDHKAKYGERKTEVDATYIVPAEEGNGEKTEEEKPEDDGGLWGWLTGWMANDEIKQAEKEAEKNSLSADDEAKTEEIPITDEAEAYLFGLKQVGKARRKDGHQIECKVIGARYWEVGEWARVYIPSFNENSIMFISKVSHDSATDNEWIANLTLVDYPPSLGSGKSNMSSTDTSTSDSDDSSDNGGGSTDTNTDTNTDTSTDTG